MTNIEQQIQKINEAITYIVAEFNELNNKITTNINQQNKNIEEKFLQLDSNIKLLESKITDDELQISYNKNTERIDFKYKGE